MRAILTMSVLWSSSSMVQYTLMIMNKSFRGSIYVYYYLEALANILAIYIVGKIYRKLGMRSTVVYMLSCQMALMGITYFLEDDMTKSQRKHTITEPIIIFAIKISNNVFLLSLSLACYNDEGEMFFDTKNK